MKITLDQVLIFIKTYQKRYSSRNIFFSTGNFFFRIPK